MQSNLSPSKNYAVRYIGEEVEVTIDRPIGSKHPKHGFVYETHYGFLPNTKAPDREEIDAYVLGVTTPMKVFRGRCIAVIHRLDDDDDKLIVIPTSMKTLSDEEIRELTFFQEQFFTSEIVRE